MSPGDAGQESRINTGIALKAINRLLMKGKILIIDDDPEMRDKVLESLRSDNYSVLYASSGTEGLGLIRDEAPRLVICNRGIPGLDALTLLNAVAWTRANGVRFIFIGDCSAEENLSGFMPLAQNEYLQIPFTKSQLLYAVRTRLRTSADMVGRRSAA